MIENQKVVTATYELYIAGEEEGQEELYEQATERRPLIYCHGEGMMLPKFEAEMAGKEVGDTFDFVINKEDAYGDYDERGLKTLPKEMFYNGDGEFDEERVAEGKVIPMLTQDGQTVHAFVTEVTDKTVQIDLNHPLAGEYLHFVGCVIDVRDATPEELEQIRHPHKGCGKCCGKYKGEGQKAKGECCGQGKGEGRKAKGECCGQGKDEGRKAKGECCGGCE